MSDLSKLTQSLESDPRDPVTINALADWIEERGGDPVSVRNLTIEDGSVIVLGYSGPPQVISQVAEFTTSEAEQIQQFPPGTIIDMQPGAEFTVLEDPAEALSRQITAWLKSRGLDVLVVAAPADMAIRQIKVNVRKETNP